MKFSQICFIERTVKMLNAKSTDCSSTYFGPHTRSRVHCSSFKNITDDQVITDSTNIAEKLSKKFKGSKPTDSIKSHKPKLEVKWEPNDWRDQFNNIRIMRKDKSAPVDTMGCERCTKDGYSEKEKRFHLLVSLMLSSQTKDEITHAAMNRLLEHGLTVKSLLEMPDKDLGELIYPVGFWRKKVVYLKKAALILKDEYNCDIPNSVENLVKLPGVGPKMAYLAMNCAWNQVVGIGVDVHVHRISNRLGWVRKKTKEPEQTRKDLESWLPQSMWKEANWLLVGFGQQICLPVSPKCAVCLNRDICPSSTSKAKK